MKTLFTWTLSLCLIFILNAQSNDSKYNKMLENIENKRIQFNKEYQNCETKKIIIKEARSYLLQKLASEVLPYWYGTPWDFNGTTRTPKQGEIACGYFITNTLTDVGFNIPRIKWAQSASEVFIKKLAPKDLKRFSYKSMSLIKKHLLDSGDGLYVVGLDSHVGYILVLDQQIQFIHSSYYDPSIGVTSESLTTDNPLTESNYRIIGKLFSDQMILNWLAHNRYL